MDGHSATDPFACSQSSRFDKDTQLSDSEQMESWLKVEFDHLHKSLVHRART